MFYNAVLSGSLHQKGGKILIGKNLRAGLIVKYDYDAPGAKSQIDYFKAGIVSGHQMGEGCFIILEVFPNKNRNNCQIVSICKNGQEDAPEQIWIVSEYWLKLV